MFDGFIKSILLTATKRKVQAFFLHFSFLSFQKKGSKFELEWFRIGLRRVVHMHGIRCVQSACWSWSLESCSTFLEVCLLAITGSSPAPAEISWEHLQGWPWLLAQTQAGGTRRYFMVCIDYIHLMSIQEPTPSSPPHKEIPFYLQPKGTRERQGGVCLFRCLFHILPGLNV